MQGLAKQLSRLFCMACLILAPGILTAQTSAGATAERVAEGSAQLMAELKRVLPDIPVEGVHELPIAGMYGIEVGGGQVLYGTADGKYLFSGDLYQLGDKLLNLAESRRAIKRKQKMDEVPLDEMVVFSPTGKRKTYVSVFTDVDCTYCRKLHQEMAEINALGIEVRYLAYPRAGLGTPTHNKIVSAWCAQDPNAAMTSLKAGQSIPNASCENPVADQFALGQAVGVTGTPAIVTEDGRLLPGYMPAAALAEAVGL